MLTDFDDTAAEQNVAELLLSRFGDPTWQDIRRRFRAGEFTLNQYQEITFRNILADRETMQGYVKQNANLRPYFGELWRYCQEHAIPMAVVSQGLDFYIEALLEKEGCSQVPVHAVTTHFTTQGISYEYRYPYPGKEGQGNSKGVVVDSYLQRGHYIIYIGDGLSDFEAADKADLLFAHRTLAEECQRRQVPFRPFTDFQDVLSALDKFSLDGTGASVTNNSPASETGGSEEAPT